MEDVDKISYCSHYTYGSCSLNLPREKLDTISRIWLFTAKFLFYSFSSSFHHETGEMNEYIVF